MVERTAIDWALLPVRRYADFEGRAPRSEYWWYTLAISLIGIAIEFVDEWIGGAIVGVYGPMSLLFTLGLFVPGLAVMVRRLHDTNRSGWWGLLSAGSYVFMVAGFSDSDPEAIFSNLEGWGMGDSLALVLAWVISMIVLLIFMVTRGDDGANRFGADPYGPDQLEEIFA